MEITETNKLWDVFTKTKDKGIKDRLILMYVPLVRCAAGRLSVYASQHVEYDDLVSYGVFGLIDAIEKFDPNKGAAFETYATLRIRGSIIDNIRKLDWVPRSMRQRHKNMAEIYTGLEQEYGREPTDAEVAEKMDLTLEEVAEEMKKAAIVGLISLEDYLDQNHDKDSSDAIEQEPSPDKAIEQEEVKTILIEAINCLAKQEKLVINLYYFEEFTLKEISEALSLSQSRISQIHSKAIFKLQLKLGKHRSLLFQ